MAGSNKSTTLEVEIGQRIMILRGEETQEELAAAVGVSREVIQHWERGTRHIKAGHLRALSEHFGKSVDYLVGLVGDDNSTNDEKLRTVSEFVGLSNKAVSKLHGFSEYIKAHPAGFVPNPYDVLLSFDGPYFTLQPEGKRVSASEIFRVSLSDYLRERASELTPDEINELDDETNEDLFSISEWLSTFGYVAVQKQRITDSLLQDAFDALKALFREYGDNMRETDNNGKKKKTASGAGDAESGQ